MRALGDITNLQQKPDSPLQYHKGKENNPCTNQYSDDESENSCNDGEEVKKKGRQRKKVWSKEEDEKLCYLVSTHGTSTWVHISKQLPGRSGKQCRERWYNKLDPSIKKGNWCPEEDRLLLHLHKELGNKWALMSKQLAGRPSNSIKNRWHSHLKRKFSHLEDNGENTDAQLSKRVKIDNNYTENKRNSPSQSPPFFNGNTPELKISSGGMPYCFNAIPMVTEDIDNCSKDSQSNLLLRNQMDLKVKFTNSLRSGLSSTGAAGVFAGFHEPRRIHFSNTPENRADSETQQIELNEPIDPPQDNCENSKQNQTQEGQITLGEKVTTQHQTNLNNSFYQSIEPVLHKVPNAHIVQPPTIQELQNYSDRTAYTSEESPNQPTIVYENNQMRYPHFHNNILVPNHQFIQTTPNMHLVSIQNTATCYNHNQLTHNYNLIQLDNIQNLQPIYESPNSQEGRNTTQYSPPSKQASMDKLRKRIKISTVPKRSIKIPVIDERQQLSEDLDTNSVPSSPPVTKIPSLVVPQTPRRSARLRKKKFSPVSPESPESPQKTPKNYFDKESELFADLEMYDSCSVSSTPQTPPNLNYPDVDISGYLSPSGFYGGSNLYITNDHNNTESLSMVRKKLDLSCEESLLNDEQLPATLNFLEPFILENNGNWDGIGWNESSSVSPF